MRLFVQPWFGFDHDRPTGWNYKNLINWERAILSIFRKNGYDIIRDSQCSSYSDGDISLIFESEIENVSEILPSPLSLSPTQAFYAQEPVVVKLKNSHIGRGKFLLETTEQKRIFFSYLMSMDPFTNYYNDFQNNLERLHNFNVEDLNENELACWEFQEFIETPGEYYSSIRVLTGVDKKIYYSQLLRSREKKSKFNLVGIVKNRSSPLTLRHNIFADHNSIYFLESRDICSNCRGGIGVTIQLDGKKIKEKADRELIFALGMDPDAACLDESAKNLCAAIGYGYRFCYPFHGHDITVSTKYGFLHFETNVFPAVYPEDLMLRRDLKQPGAYIYLICKIANIQVDIDYLMELAPKM